MHRANGKDPRFAADPSSEDDARFGDFTARTTEEVLEANRLLEPMVHEATRTIAQAAVTRPVQAARSRWAALSAASLLLASCAEKAIPPPDPLPPPQVTSGAPPSSAAPIPLPPPPDPLPPPARR